MGITLTDECNFLLQAVDQLGALLLAEQKGRQQEREAAAQRLADANEALRSASQEAFATARKENKRQLDELAAEAEAHRGLADSLQRLAAAAQDGESHRAELELMEALERDCQQLGRMHLACQEELQELRAAKAQRQALAVAASLEDMRRRLERATSDGPPHSGGCAGPTRPCSCRGVQTEPDVADPGRIPSGPQ